jgi:peptide/nickel transport system substrate-binding protein
MNVRKAVTSIVAAGLVLAVAFVAPSAAALKSGVQAQTAIPLLTVGDQLTGTSSLDPKTNQGCGAGCGLYLEHLLTIGPTGKLVPQLAASYTQPGKAVYVFHLRHGVKFSDGNEMTSADVANAINYQRYPGTETSAYFQSVKSVVATDRYTVVITLRHVDASFLGNLWFEGAVWEQRFQEAHKTTFGNPGTLIIGTGPWQVDSFNPTSGMELSPKAWALEIRAK